MNKFASLTILAVALAALIYSQSTLALPGDDPPAADPAQESPAAESEGDSDAADPAEPEVPERPADPEALAIFQEAQNRLFTHTSIRSRFREIVSIPNRPFTAEGTYLAGDFPQMRLEYAVEVADMRGTLLQVCDGQVSWTREEVIPIPRPGEDPSEEETYSHTARRNIDEILREIAKRPELEGSSMIAELGIGGLPAMMAGVEKMMTFDHHETIEWNGRGYIVVEGHWREDLPPHVQQFTAAGPERVKVFLAEDSLFPERFVYLKRISPDGEDYHELLELQFLDVEFDAPVAPEAFSFASPPGTEEHDETQVYLMMLQQLGSEAEATQESTAAPME